jgi:uncharacterized phage infection (PIP) family protein YhgE
MGRCAGVLMGSAMTVEANKTRPTTDGAICLGKWVLTIHHLILFTMIYSVAFLVLAQKLIILSDRRKKNVVFLLYG